MSDRRIIVEKADNIATVTTNRAERHNVMDMQFFSEFGPCIDHMSHDSQVRAVILTGAGRSFCSGIDLVSLAEAAQGPAALTSFLSIS